MSQKDEELQDRIENGTYAGMELDAQAYRKLFSVIGQEPVVKLSKNFADRVSAKLVAARKRESKRDLVWLSFGVLFLLVGLIVTAALSGLQLQLGFLKEMSPYAGVFIFGILVIIAFNFVEKRAIPKVKQPQ